MFYVEGFKKNKSLVTFATRLFAENEGFEPPEV